MGCGGLVKEFCCCNDGGLISYSTGLTSSVNGNLFLKSSSSICFFSQDTMYELSSLYSLKICSSKFYAINSAFIRMSSLVDWPGERPISSGLDSNSSSSSLEFSEESSRIDFSEKS